MVGETLQFLDCVCGSTTGGLGLLGLYINEGNVHLVSQTLETLTEYCQGPCHENQVNSAIMPYGNCILHFMDLKLFIVSMPRSFVFFGCLYYFSYSCMWLFRLVCVADYKHFLSSLYLVVFVIQLG